MERPTNTTADEKKEAAALEKHSIMTRFPSVLPTTWEGANGSSYQQPDCHYLGYSIAGELVAHLSAIVPTLSH